jgi:linoleoyl-CoA desaturase
VLQPIYNLVLAAFFEWGVATHDLDFEAIKTGEKTKEQVRRELKGMAVKGRAQIVKDYLAFPLISAAAAGAATWAGRTALEATRRHSHSPVRRGLESVRRRRRAARAETITAAADAARATFRSTLRADFTANVVRNVWAYAIIFCGHFPDQTYTFSQEEVEGETRGGFYVRQLLGAANIDGTPLFHVISGNLGYQVEHHLYPDMPSTRYGEIAPRVKEICKRYELPYNTGPFLKQLGAVQRTILRLAFPGGKPRPKPGPYRGHDASTRASASADGGAGLAARARVASSQAGPGRGPVSPVSR